LKQLVNESRDEISREAAACLPPYHDKSPYFHGSHPAHAQSATVLPEPDVITWLEAHDVGFLIQNRWPSARCSRKPVACHDRAPWAKPAGGEQAPRETAQLPCAPILPWAKTRQQACLRVPRRPAHDKTKAHGKKFICRVLANKTHGKLNTHVKTPSLPSVYFMAHGKEAVWEGMARGPCICRVPHYGTRQRGRTSFFAILREVQLFDSYIVILKAAKPQ